MTFRFVGLIAAALALAPLDAFAQVPYLYENFSFIRYASLIPKPVRVASPWEWTVEGSSSNMLFTDPSDPGHGGMLAVSYSGSGNWTLTRHDVAGTHGRYQIQYQDDGSKPAGEMFVVIDAVGHWIAIAANDHVAPGQFYVRTDRDAGNRGITIPVYRNNNVVNGWHDLTIEVTPMGAYPLVDGVEIPGYLYTDVTDGASVQLVGNWGKAPHRAVYDNLSVATMTGWINVPVGTSITNRGQIHTSAGSDLSGITSYNILQMYERGDGAAWAAANPTRYSVIKTAIQESWRGLCGAAAHSYYNVSGKWCSEFAVWVLGRSQGINPDWAYRWGNGYQTLRDIQATVQLATFYQSTECGLVGTGIMSQSPPLCGSDHVGGSWLPKPGDYLAMVSSEGERFGHSELVVGVADDASSIWTVAGNVGDCVRFQRRDLYVNGTVASNLDAFGNTEALLGRPPSGSTPNCR